MLLDELLETHIILNIFFVNRNSSVRGVSVFSC